MAALMHPAPTRTTAQRMRALEHANEIRVARKELKADLKARRTSPADVLLDVPEWAETMKVVTFLLATPKIGRVKAEKILRLNQISPSKTLAALSMRQRALLVGALR